MLLNRQTDSLLTTSVLAGVHRTNRNKFEQIKTVFRTTQTNELSYKMEKAQLVAKKLNKSLLHLPYHINYKTHSC
jgi:uncharacterized FlaG/YvyC family protein